MPLHHRLFHQIRILAVFLPVLAAITSGCGEASKPEPAEQAVAYFPSVPPPIRRKSPALVHVDMNATVRAINLAPGVVYRGWTFNDHVPGPFIRAREGDTLEIEITNADPTGMPHNIDFHAVIGPGGGADATTVVPGERHTAQLKLLHPGLFIYHCGAPPVPDHIANGMYGMILVEPKSGLATVDREYCVMQSEFYTTDPKDGTPYVELSRDSALQESPRYVVFNGRYGSLMGDGMLKANTGESVRIFFGNAGPNKIASFHIIGEVLDRVYREGDLLSTPGRSIQTTLVPPGGAAAVEFTPQVPGLFKIVDHAIYRTEKGAAGLLEVKGSQRPDLYRWR